MTFAEHPDELARLQADPSLAASAVEEVLRWQGAVAVPGPLLAARPRVARASRSPPAARCSIVTGAANRDPRAYDEPDRFDITPRGAARHQLRPRHPLLHRRPPGPPRRRASPSPSSTVGGPTSRSTSTPSSTCTWPTSPARRPSPSPPRRTTTHAASPRPSPRERHLRHAGRGRQGPQGRRATSTSAAAGSRCARSTAAAIACRATARATPTLLGKRYADDELGLELLCTQGGDGALSIGDTPLLVKGAKPLPSSD